MSSQPANSPASAFSADKSTGRRSHAATDGPTLWLAAAILAISIGIVYARSLNSPFVLDDNGTVTSNASVHSLWPPIGTEERPGPLNPARDLTTAGRPLVNYSFALNYHFGGLNVVGYHVVNLAVHFFCALLLFAIIRRVLRLQYFAGRFESIAGWLAFVAALLWSVHPLLTDAVAYITQRTELMMAFFYLATIYCSLRYWSTLPLSSEEGRGEGALHVPHLNQRIAWLFLAVLTCLSGMLSKEVMVSAPIVVLVFERMFFTRSFAGALRRSWPLYVGLAATWIPLLILSANAPRSLSAGFHLCENPIVYWFTQCKVLLMYLKLVIWPWPLRCAYELPKVDNIVAFCIYVVPVLLMSAFAIVLLMRNHAVGFVFFFVGAILAPTSIVPILTETAAERRMYLPLAALVVLVVVGIYLFVKRQLRLGVVNVKSAPEINGPLVVGFLSVAAVGVIYGGVSAYRLGDYYDEILMWQQVIETQPYNYGAHYNLGLLYNHAGREAESMAELEAAVAAKPDYQQARSALGFALITAGRLPEAFESLQAALTINPDYVPALNNMGIALTKMGRYPQAIEYLQHALQINPGHADAHSNLGQALMSAGRTAEAAEQLQIARSLAPDDPDVLFNLATSHANKNELPQAIELFERALRVRPDFAAAHNGIGIALHRSGDVRGAAEHFQRFQQLKPNEAGAYINLAIVATGDEAIQHFQKALELNPNMLPAYAALANALASANRGDEAVKVAQRGIEAARSQGDQTTVEQLQDWLAHFQSGATTQ